MTAYREEETITRRETVDPAYDPAVRHRSVIYGRGTGSMVERVVVFIFGIIQALLLIRIVLLLVAAREGNAIVAFVYDLSQVFVAPFRGILRIDEVVAGQTQLDVAAIVALIGWTLIELLVLGLVRTMRPTATA